MLIIKTIMPNATPTGKQVEPIRKALLAALLEAGYSQNKACKIIKLSPNSAIAIRKQKAPPDGTVEIIKREISKKFWFKADSILDAMDDLDIMALSGKDKAVAAGILVDKALLLDGQPTQRIQHTIGVSELDRQIEDKRRELGELAKQADIVIDVEADL